MPRSRATCAIGFPVSSTIRTAPSRNSRSYFFRFSGISILIVEASTVRGEPQSAGVTGWSGCCVVDQGLGGLLELHALLLGELEQQRERMVTAAVVLCDEDA